MLVKILLGGILAVVMILAIAQAITVIAPYLGAIIVIGLIGWCVCKDIKPPS